MLPSKIELMIDGAQSHSPKVTKKTTIRFFNPRHKQCRGRKLRTYQFVTGAVDEVVPVDGRVPLEAALAEHHVHEGQRTLKSEIVVIFNAATDHLPSELSVGGVRIPPFSLLLSYLGSALNQIPQRG